MPTSGIWYILILGASGSIHGFKMKGLGQRNTQHAWLLMCGLNSHWHPPDRPAGYFNDLIRSPLGPKKYRKKPTRHLPPACFSPDIHIVLWSQLGNVQSTGKNINRQDLNKFLVGEA